MERVRVNPVIPGFAPDPALVFVDGTYFLVNSSFHLFPGLPVYASKDLVTWKQIGNAVNRPGQIRLQQSCTKIVGEGEDIVCSQGGLYAPTIRYHQGTCYIVCTNVLHTQSQPLDRNKKQNFILSTTNIWADEWSDPVFFDFDAIDTSLFWDDDGKVYLVGAAGEFPDSSISQFEIDLKTGERLSDCVVLWRGITGVYPEGPHMYKRDGWYYLLIAEGGCFADHHTIMARSRNIWGPYEYNPANPVLGKTSPDKYIQYTGHGDLFQDPSGQWYFVCLGVRKVNGRFIMGRESVLTTASWPVGEFPTIDTVQPEVAISKGLNPCSEWPRRSRDTTRPDIGLIHIRDPVEEDYKYEGEGITLLASKADFTVYDEPVTYVGKRQRLLEGSASSTLEVTASTISDGGHLKTGLCYYKDEHRYVRIFVDFDTREIILEILNKAKKIGWQKSRTLERLAEGDRITFGVDYTELQLNFWFRSDGDGQQRTEFPSIDTLDMTGHDFVGPTIGIFAVGSKRVKVHYSGLVVPGF